MPVAVGIGLTNECNLACPHCYRPTMTQQRLSVPQVETILDNLDVGSVNLGVGENGVHPEYRRMLALFRAAPIPAGEHVVELRYESWTPRAGTLVSFLTTLALTGLVGVRLVRRD